MEKQHQQRKDKVIAVMQSLRQVKMRTWVLSLIAIHVLAAANYLLIFRFVSTPAFLWINSIFLLAYLLVWYGSIRMAKTTQNRTFLVIALIYWIICLIGSILDQSQLLSATVSAYYSLIFAMVFVPIYRVEYIFFIQAFYLLSGTFVVLNWLELEQSMKGIKK